MLWYAFRDLFQRKNVIMEQSGEILNDQGILDMSFLFCGRTLDKKSEVCNYIT